MNKIIELLCYRGFYIEEIESSYVLSDNSEKSDLEMLDSILQSSKTGYVTNNTIIITEDNPEKLSYLFAEKSRGVVGVGSNYRIHGWHVVKKRVCADKIPLNWLEANIARYIRSLSACGIYTGGCCDGNHPNSNELYIEFDGPVYSKIHRLFWVYKLADKFELNWNHQFTGIKLINKEKEYVELNKAAEYIYENRNYFRDMRMRAADWMTNRSVRELSEEEIKSKYIDALIALLEGEFI